MCGASASYSVSRTAIFDPTFTTDVNRTLIIVHDFLLISNVFFVLLTKLKASTELLGLMYVILCYSNVGLEELAVSNRGSS